MDFSKTKSSSGKTESRERPKADTLKAQRRNFLSTMVFEIIFYGECSCNPCAFSEKDKNLKLDNMLLKAGSFPLEW